MVFDRQPALYGVILAVCATICFAVTVILLSIILSAIDAVTTTWYRCFVGAILVSIFMSAQDRKQARHHFFERQNIGVLLLIGVLFVFYQLIANVALIYIPPSSVQVMGQLSIFLTVFCGIFLLKEPFSRHQTLGLLILLIGLGFFFHHRWGTVFSLQGDYYIGIMLMVLSACAWAASAIVQKKAVRKLPGSTIVVSYFWLSALILLPFSNPFNPAVMTIEIFIPVLLAGATTVLGASLYTAALKHADASRVTPIVALTPLLTIAFVHPALLIWPGTFIPETVDFLSLFGALLVVIGSSMASLTKGQSDT